MLMVFVPDNSKTICIDQDELILREYEAIINTNKDLTDWYKFLTMFRESSFTKVEINEESKDLPIHICENSYDKLLITDSKSKYSKFKADIIKKGINILDKDLARVQLNYGLEAFPTTQRSKFSEVNIENVHSVVNEICAQFKDVVENKGLFKLIVDKNGKRVTEKKAQLVFFGVAYSHCQANDLKLSPEVDSGNGPVDFNISKGFKANVNVEMKFADNPKIGKGLWSQLQIYNRADNTKKSIYLIIKTNNLFDHKLSQLTKVLDLRKKKGANLPDVIIIDSSFKASASIR